MKNIFFASAFLLISIVSFSQGKQEDLKLRVVFGDLKHDGPYDRSEVLLQEELNVVSNDGNEYKVSSFHLTIAPANGKPTRFEVIGNKLPVKLQGSLNQIVGGDKIMIERVFAIISNDPYDLAALAPITFSIKKFENNGPYNVVNANELEPVTIDKGPQVSLGNISVFEEYTLEDIIKQTELMVTSPDGAEYIIKRFRMIVAFKGSPAMMASSNTNQLSEPMLKILSRVTSGDRIIFEGIRAVTTVDGQEFKANFSPLVYTTN